MLLPADFIIRTHALLGDDFKLLEAALLTPSPISIRTNSRKIAVSSLKERVPWCSTGYYLPERLSFTFDPLFHAGAYYVQEASSMFLEQAIRQYISSPVTCLDLCAAPGGKSTHLLSVLPDESLLVSNEVIRSRSLVLAENITKWGNPSHLVTSNDPEEIGLLPPLFDVIVADVPCSGEGMFRKDAGSADEWSVNNIQLCASRQRRIIHDCWKALNPGGLLIYSTCTYNTEENEENIHSFTEELGATVLPVSTDIAWNISGPLKHPHPVYRFFPHKTKGEGFFLAVLQKPDDSSAYRLQPASSKGKYKKETYPTFPQEWLLQEKTYLSDKIGNTVIAFPQASWDRYRLLREKLKIVSAGICLGEQKGKDWLPAHSLAMSTALNMEAFPSVELSWEEAIRYLRKEALPLPESTVKGFVLLTYKGIPLGFAKQLGNRANNLYPSEWRIRTGYQPEIIKNMLERIEN